MPVKNPKVIQWSTQFVIQIVTVAVTLALAWGVVKSDINLINAKIPEDLKVRLTVLEKDNEEHKRIHETYDLGVLVNELNHIKQSQNDFKITVQEVKDLVYDLNDN